MRAWPVLLLVVGCNWVTEADISRRMDELDDDGDGYYRDGGGDASLVDCDDTDPNVHPGAEETWYDGIDSDCAGDDDYDQDGDSYPDPSSGQAVTDCDDTDPNVHPNAEDAWYDGIDSDCAGNDDYDKDGDGYDSAEHLEGGLDCDDDLPEVNPSAEDAWYDGIDSDCAGNDDYDQDGDGYVPEAYVGLPTTYVPGSGTGLWFDCDDTDPTIHVDAKDAWYDGIDSDCAGNDDYDQDGDGWQHPSSGTVSPDCDDTDPTARPDGIEDLATSVDEDCDGAGDRAAATATEPTWTGPHDPRYQEEGGTIYLSVVADVASWNLLSWHETAVAMTWDALDPTGPMLDVLPWQDYLPDSTGPQVTSGQAFLAADGLLYGATGLVDASGRTLRLARFDPAVRLRDSSPANWPGVVDPYDDVTMVRNAAGDIFVAGCSGDTGGAVDYFWAQASTDDLGSGVARAKEEVAVQATACALSLEGDTGGLLRVVEAGTGAEITFSFVPGQDSTASFTEIARDDAAGLVTLDAWEHDGSWWTLAVRADGSIRIDDGTGPVGFVPPSGLPAIEADLAYHPLDGSLLLAWVDATGKVGIAQGADPASLVAIGSVSPPWTPDQVAVHVAADGVTLLVALTSGSGVARAMALLP